MTTKKDQETKEQEKPVTQADIDRQNRINFATQALSQDGYNRGLGGFLKDTTLSALSGAVSVPQMAVGLLDIPTGGRVGKFLENEDGMIGFRPSEARQIIGDWKSDEGKMQTAQYRNADGIMAKAGKVLSNPTMLADAVTESLPTMLAGGVIGRGVGLAHKGLSALSRGAIGEGVAMAGLSASENRAESENGLLTNKQILGSIGTGVAGSAFSYAGGRLAQRLGVDDIDTAVVRGSLADDTARKLGQEQIDAKLLAGEIGNGTTNRAVGGLKGLAKGAVLEGFTEELPQTMSETAINNWANDRPLMKDMANNAVLATLSGMAMGSPTGAISGVNNAKNNQALQQRLEQLQQAQQNSIAQEAPANLPTVAGNDGHYDLSDIDTAPTTPIGFHEDVATSSVNEHTYSLPSDMGQTIGTRSMPDDVPDVANDPNYPLPTAQSGQNPQSQEVPTNLPDVANDEQPTPQNKPLADVNPQTFANPQNFDSWLNQEEFVNQYKVQQELNAQKPSERMGLDPNQGSLTRSAVVAVDSGATQAVNPQAGVVAGATGEQAQEGTLARASMQSEPLSAYQTQLQERTAQQEVQAQEAKAVFANAPKLIGKQNYIQNQNERLPTQIMAVEADSLMPSVDNTTNQARDRSRTASRVQVDNIANNLDPMQLTDSTVMGHGSPTISDDGTIIAGNGRTMAIKQAYAQGKADEYRQMLMERADEYGLDKTALAGMKNPVLVKSVGNVGADKLRQLALNSNETGTMTQSAFENARADVERVANINLNQLHADERGDINTSSNRHIINEFVSQFPIEQQNAMRTSNGVLSKQGLERFENALLLSAYGDNPTTQAILESTDEEVRNAVKAIVATAPTVAKTKQGIQDGITPNDDIASDITEALSMLAKLRREGVKPSDYLAQTNLFGDELSPTGQRLLAFMDANIKSVVKIRQLLYKYYDNLSQENLKQNDMFGKETQTKQSRLNQALQELGHDQFVQPTTATTTATAEQARPTSQASQVNERPEKSVSDGQGIGRDDGRVTQKPKNALDGLKSKREAKAKAKINPNANDSERSSGVLSDGAKTGLSSGVNKKQPTLTPKDEAKQVLQGEVVAHIDESKLNMPTSGGYKAVTAWAMDLFNQWDNVANSPILGDVILNEQSIRDSISHDKKLNPYKNLALASIKDVLEKGVLIHADYNTKGEDSFYIAAPVMLNNNKNIVTVLVHRDVNTQRMYLHYVGLVEKLMQSHQNMTVAQDKTSRKHNRSATASDIASIIQGLLDVKHDTQTTAQALDNALSTTNQADFALSDEMVQTGVSERVNADFASYVKNHDTLAKAAKAYFDDHLKGKAFDTVIGKVHILGSSWQKKLKAGISNQKVDEVKAFAIPFISDILTNGHYDGVWGANKERKDAYVRFHSFSKEVSIRNKPTFVRVLVGERENNEFELVVYNLYPNKKSDDNSITLIGEPSDFDESIANSNQENKSKETPNSSGLSEVTKALLGDGNSLAKSDNDVNTKQTTAQALDSHLTNSQKRALEAIEKLPDSDSKKAQFLDELYQLDPSDSKEASDERYRFVTRVSAYELVQRKAHELAGELTDLGYTVKVADNTVFDNTQEVATQLGIKKNEKTLNVVVNKTIQQGRANDTSRDGFFVKDGTVSYKLDLYEMNVGERIHNHADYVSNKQYFGKDRPIYHQNPKPTDWQQRMAGQLARLYDDDPALAGFIEQANNKELPPGQKNSLLQSIKHYASIQEKKGNALAEHDVMSQHNDTYHKGKMRFSQMGGYQKDLIVTHNISADGILHAHKMGGLPYASIAITKQHTPLDNFGEVTLIGDSRMIDPQGDNNAQVFGSDIYSPRYPTVYYTISEQDSNRLYEKFYEASQAVGDTRLSFDVNQGIEQKGVVTSLTNSVSVMYQFLKEQNIDIPLVYRETETPTYLKLSSVQKAIKDGVNLARANEDSVFLTEFFGELADSSKQKLEQLLRQEQPNKMTKKILENQIQAYEEAIKTQDFRSNVKVNSVINALEKEFIASNRQEKEMDNTATKEAIQKAIETHKKAFDDYVQNIASKIKVKEKLYDGETRTGEERYVGHTLLNVVKKLKKDLRGGEQTNYGLPTLRAKITPKFDSISDIRYNKHRLSNKADFEMIKAEFETAITELGTNIGLASTYRIEDFLDSVIDNGSSKAFKEFGIKTTVTNKKLVADFIAKLESMPTEYFEVKAKDVTQFSDFKGAVIPKDLPKKARQILEQAGLILYEYGNDNRADVIKKATFELDERLGDILFQRQDDVVSPINEQAKVLQGEPVSVIDESTLDMPQEGGFNVIQKWATDLFVKQGGKAINPTLGEITLNNQSVRDSLAHGKFSPFKNVAFAGVKDVLEKGVIVAVDKNHSTHDSYFISAPVLINGKENIITVTVHKDSASQKMYLHGVMLKEHLMKPRVSEARRVNSRQHLSSLTSSDIHNILQNALNYKEQNNSRQGSRYGTTADEVLDTLNKRFGKDTIAKLQANDSLKVLSLAQAREQFGNIPDDADGFYVGGTAYLIHDNIHPDMIIPTFLHELGGHGGLQTLMSDTAYQGFMREFDRLVSENNPLAVEAKNLADKHSKNKKEAQSEYLPYLITLASRQKENQGKLKSLINRMMMAIRTFIRQKLGVSLPVTPDEIVLVAEKAVRERASGGRGNGVNDVQFSYNDSKKDRLEKLKNSKPIEITGREIEPSDDVKEYRKNAYEYGKKLRGTYTNKDTGRTTKVVRESLNEVLRHHAKDEAHLQSIVAIPQIIENAIYIETLPNEDKAKNPLVKEYEYYVVGLKIDGVDYTVKAVLAIDDRDDRYYDHRLTKIEKGNLLASTVRLTNAAVAGKLPLDEYDRRLLQILQDKNDEPDIQFSRMADFYENNAEKAKETVEKLGKVASDFIANPKSFVKQGASNAKADHLDKFLQFLGRRQLTDLYGKKLKGLKEYNDRVAQMDADSNETAFRADQLVNKWAKVKDSQALAELMHDVTLAGIDPTAPIVAAKNAKHAQLKARYDRLSDMAKEVFNQAKDDYQTHYENLHRAMVERIQRNDKLTDERKAKLIDELDKELQASKKAFFPLTRFGDYVVVVRDTDGNVINVARAETKGQADALRQQLIKDNPNHKVDNVVLGREMDIRNLAGIKGLASEFLADDLGLDDKLHQDYLNALLDREFATNNVMIKNTAGFSQNARRAYAHHMSRGSHHIAKLRHTDRLKADLERMQAYIDSQDGDVIELQRVMDELNKRHELLLNPPSHPVSSLATAAGFMWYMGLSPASALVNLSQTLLVAMPMMSAKYGFAKSNKMLGEISALLAKNKNDLSNALTGNEKKAFDEAVRRGVIDMTQAHDLAGVANGENSMVMEKIKPVMKVASFMFHQAEKFNRQVTFVASYRLAVQKGLTSEQAMEEAIKITYDGHFDYASSNRPRFMQGNWQRVLFLFKQYGQNMVYTLARQTYLSFKGETPEQKREARKIMAGILAGHAMTAGILGLPLVTTLLAFASALGGDDDEPWDAEVALRNQLANLLGDDMAEVLAKGLPRAVGMDLSSRVGLDSLILPRLQDGLEGQRLGENLLVGLAGPVFSIPFVSMPKGMSQIGQGQTLQGIENMIPKALRDPLKAYRYATQGNVDKSGIEIVEKENVGVSDIAQQAIGFRSGKFAQAQEVKSAIYQADKQLTAIRSDLVRQYALAKRNGDDEQMDRIWEEIKRFNVKHPSVKITKPALMKSIRQRQRRIDNAKDGIYLSKNREHLREYGAFGVD